MKKKIALIFVAIIALLLTACTNKEQANKDIDATPNEDSEVLTVYTTVYPLQYFSERIGGDAVRAQSIYPPGADEHTFDPTQKAMMALADADLFFYIGLGLEGFVENAEKTMINEHVKMIPIAESISADLLGESHDEAENESHDEHDHGKLDPHVWISPKLSIELASSIKDSLIEVAPEKKLDFEKNFELLREDLVALDQRFEEMATSVPKNTFFVSHAAFGYLANTYHLEQIAVAGLNSQSEPSQKQLASLVNYAKEHDIKYVLFEQNVSSNLTKVIQKEIGADALTLHNLGVLTVEDVQNNEDYFTLMDQNLETLRQALSE